MVHIFIGFSSSIFSFDDNFFFFRSGPEGLIPLLSSPITKKTFLCVFSFTESNQAKYNAFVSTKGKHKEEKIHGFSIMLAM